MGALESARAAIPTLLILCSLFASCATPSKVSPLDGTWKLSSVDCADGSTTELLRNYQRYVADTKHEQRLEVHGTRVVMRSRDWDPASKKFCETAFEEIWELTNETYRTIERRALPLPAGEACPPAPEHNSGRPHRFTLSGDRLDIFDASSVTTAADVAKDNDPTRGKPFCETGTLVWRFAR